MGGNIPRVSLVLDLKEAQALSKLLDTLTKDQLKDLLGCA